MMEGSGTLENQLEATKVGSGHSRDCHCFCVDHMYKMHSLLVFIVNTNSV